MSTRTTICPIMSGMTAGFLYGDGSSTPPEFQEVNCLGEKCEWFIFVRTTEGDAEGGCSLRLGPQIENGRIPA